MSQRRSQRDKRTLTPGKTHTSFFARRESTRAHPHAERLAAELCDIHQARLLMTTAGSSEVSATQFR